MAHNTLSPFDVAQHWPFVKRHLAPLPTAADRALGIVADGQVGAGGEAVAVRARALELGLTAGEAGRVGMVLAELERAGVLWRYRGRGRLPSLWSFETDLTRWRGVGWSTSSSAVAEAVRACVCRAADAFVARSPGHSVGNFRNRPNFELLSRDHLRPPGLFLVETRDNCGDRATNAAAPGLSRAFAVDNSAVSTDPPAVSLLSENSENSPSEEQEHSYARLRDVLLHHSPPTDSLVGGRTPERDLRWVAAALTPGQVRALVRRFDRSIASTGAGCRVPSGARELRRMAEAIAGELGAVAQ